jgi:ATP-dependent phosphofructokinase / diphosphate-dependent phosphofructokinase
MTSQKRRIAINFGGGYVPGLNAVITGTVLAASRLGWEVAGIRDGFEGLLFPARYPEGGLIELTPRSVENLSGVSGCILGTASQSDPFHVRNINAENQVEELDRSDELLEKIEKQQIDGVVSVVGSRALSILWKLSRKGLKTVAVPKSVENDVASTALSFGFNSALSFVAEMLEKARNAAQSARRIGVVEVLGEHAGWLALQSGMSVCADAVLIPEIPYDLQAVAAALKRKMGTGRHYGLVVVAEGAVSATPAPEPPEDSLKRSLAPLANSQQGFVIEHAGRAAQAVAHELQRLTGEETSPLVLGQLVKGGSATAVDRQLGLGYGAAAVRALNENRTGVMVTFQPPDMKSVPLREAINKIRTVPPNSPFVEIARSLGISLGD